VSLGGGVYDERRRGGGGGGGQCERERQRERERERVFAKYVLVTLRKGIRRDLPNQ